jgi:hypothetical protein
MKTAVKPQAKAKAARSGLPPGFSPVSRGAAPTGQRQAPASLAPPPSRRGKITPLTPMRVQAAKSMSRLADKVRESHPDLPAAQHLMDAARTLRAGQHEASQRHLRAAMFSLTPQSLMRNGMHTDDLHVGARDVMHGVHRHLLLVKDLDDVAAKNEAAVRRDSYDDDSGPMPQPPAHSTDPNAGYGPGALAQKPTARQPGGDRAMNAPNRSSSGGSDPNVADPVGPQPRGSKQFARTWDDLAGVIDLAGPHGYEHNWKFVGVPGGTGGPHGILTGPHPADKLTVASDPRATARAMSDDDLQRADVELSRRATLLGKAGQQSKGHKAAVAEIRRRGTSMSVTWDDLAAVIEMSAETGRLASTPAPIGKPGGPGLYHVKGLGHSAYFENVRNGLMKRGMDEGKASAMTWSILRRWAAGGGGVHPEVKAAAAKSIAEEEAKAHAHANSWDEVAGVVELAAVVRVPAGQAGGGQFGSGGATAAPASAGKPPAAGKKPLTAQQQAAQQQQKAKASATAKATAAATMAKNRQAKQVAKALTQAAKPPAPDPHQQHVAHMQELQKQAALKMQEKSAAKEAVGDKSGGAQTRAGLLGTAKADRAKANGLIAQRKVLMGELASASGATSSGQSGSTTSAGASTTASTAPAVAATPASTAASSTTAASSSTTSKPTAAQLTTAIAGLTSQITSLLKSAAAAQAQASKMGSAPAGKTAGPPVAAK